MEIKTTIEQVEYVELTCFRCGKTETYRIPNVKEPKDWPYKWLNRSDIENVPFKVWNAVHIFSTFTNGRWDCCDPNIIGD